MPSMPVCLNLPKTANFLSLKLALDQENRFVVLLLLLSFLKTVKLI